MKRKQYLMVLMLLMGTMMLGGCSKDNTPTETTGQEQEQAQTEEELLEYNVADYVELGEYKGLEVQYPAATVTEEDVELYIQDTIDEYTEYVEITDRAAEEGDCVNIDYTGTIAGEEFDGGSDTEYDLILGSEEFLAEFEANLVGVNAGESVTFSVTFPEDYWDEAVVGKTAEFTVTVNSVNEVVVPEYNDAFVAEVTDYGTMAEYEEAINAELKTMAEEEGVMVAGEDALYMAIENATVNGYPQEVYDICSADVVESYQFYAEMFEMEYDAFIEEYIGEDGLEETILSQVNEVLVVQAIAEQEGLAVTDENYEEEATALAAEYEYDTLEEFETDYGKNYIQMQLVRDKVIDFLYNSAKLEEVPYEEYYGEDEYYEEEETSEESEETTDEEESVEEGEETTDEASSEDGE